MKLRIKLDQLCDARKVAISNNNTELADKIWRDWSILKDYLDPPDDEAYGYSVTDECVKEIGRILRTKYV